MVRKQPAAPLVFVKETMPMADGRRTIVFFWFGDRPAGRPRQTLAAARDTPSSPAQPEPTGD